MSLDETGKIRYARLIRVLKAIKPSRTCLLTTSVRDILPTITRATSASRKRKITRTTIPARSE